MKTLIIALMMTTAAAAQDPTQMPKTVPFTAANGDIIGSATFSSNHIYIRDTKGEPIATIVVDRDGTRTIYDPHGKILDQISGSVK
jgi:hypothetical protein